MKITKSFSLKVTAHLCSNSPQIRPRNQQYHPPSYVLAATSSLYTYHSFPQDTISLSVMHLLGHHRHHLHRNPNRQSLSVSLCNTYLRVLPIYCIPPRALYNIDSTPYSITPKHHSLYPKPPPQNPLPQSIAILHQNWDLCSQKLSTGSIELQSDPQSIPSRIVS